MMETFDQPLFKRLAHNDTGKAAGKQGGIVIPKDLDRYFPQLSGKISALTPTVDVRIEAALFVNGVYLGLADTRYQYQTWRGTRLERRLTDNLSPLRNKASEDDFLVIERGLSDPLYYRLRLYTATHPAYAKLAARAGSRRWGLVNPGSPPVAETDVEKLAAAQAARELTPFEMFDPLAPLVEATSMRIARSRAFRLQVTKAYDHHCAVCGGAFVSRAGAFETEAAHIVPRGLKGSDDTRNGIALCRSHHWAFDRGLFGVTKALEVIVPPATSTVPANASITALAGQNILLPASKSLYPDAGALKWHYENVVLL